MSNMSGSRRGREGDDVGPHAKRQRGPGEVRFQQAVTEQLLFDEKGRRLYDFDLPAGKRLHIGEVKEWILKSIAMIDRAGEPMQVLHNEGLVRAQTLAARKEQDKEIKNAVVEGIREDGEQGDVKARDLLAHVDVKHASNGAARDLISGIATGSKDGHALLRTMYGSVAVGATLLPAEGAGAAKHGGALLSRLLAQAEDIRPVTEARDSVVGAAANDMRAGFELLLQMLYAFYAGLAPFHMDNATLLGTKGFEDEAPNPDPAIRLEQPLYWLSKPADTAGFSFRDESDTVDNPESRYASLFVSIVRGLRSQLVEAHPCGTTFLAEMLVGAPAIPLAVWREMDLHYCSAEDGFMYCNALQALGAVVLRRPAASARALSWLLHYTTSQRAGVRLAAVNTLVADVIPNASGHIVAQCNKYATELLDRCISLPEDGGGEGDVADIINRSLSFYFGLASRKVSLVCDLFGKAALCADRPRVQRAILGHRDLRRLLHRHGTQLTVVQHLVEFKSGAENFALRVLRQLVHDAKADLLKADQGSRKARSIDRNLLLLKGAGLDLYQTRAKDVRFLSLVLGLLPGSELREKLLPEVLTSDCTPAQLSVAVEEAVTPPPFRLLGAERWGKEPLGMQPTSLLTYLHLMEPGAQGTPGANVNVGHITRCLDACILGCPDVFSAELLAAILPRLFSAKPIPTLAMRTALQAVASHPSMLQFVLRTCLPPLRLRCVWQGHKPSHQVLWRGMARMLIHYQPQTFDAILSLPEAVILDLCASADPMSPALSAALRQHLAANRQLHSTLLAALEEGVSRGAAWVE
eukprot:TRINITY_DN39909_c0_g1_i1.p1 TRINITY_DN39909_c0_g1~~TRINITY_DN39909_c0_g1_i1.p1  ORF type:complete len:808 (+),score=228.87 TRINITY_DN39909_c0_g1_i1:82-2505(+)